MSLLEYELRLLTHLSNASTKLEQYRYKYQLQWVQEYFRTAQNHFLITN